MWEKWHFQYFLEFISLTTKSNHSQKLQMQENWQHNTRRWIFPDNLKMSLLIHQIIVALFWWATISYYMRCISFLTAIHRLRPMSMYNVGSITDLLKRKTSKTHKVRSWKNEMKLFRLRKKVLMKEKNVSENINSRELRTAKRNEKRKNEFPKVSSSTNSYKFHLH